MFSFRKTAAADTGPNPAPEPPLPRAEERAQHREQARARRRARILERYVPKHGVGIEIGVFWAHFSEQIVERFAPSRLYLVDPWDQLFGERYPAWGDYTLGGTLETDVAKAAAYALAARHPDVVQVIEDFGAPFLATLPDESLDWVYLDAAHDKASVLADLQAIAPKLKPDANILGDDYYLNPQATHKGVREAVNQFAHRTGRKLVLEDDYQYILLPKNAKRP